MQAISVFDMLKIGIGPSSSHTLGPWRAAEAFLIELDSQNNLQKVHALNVSLYGSLALTGKGHGTDIAIQMGLSGSDPVTVPIDQVAAIPEAILSNNQIHLKGQKTISFNPETDIEFFYDQRLPEHANGMVYKAFDQTGNLILQSTYYSIGGGFILKEWAETEDLETNVKLLFPIQSGEDLKKHCNTQNQSIAKLVFQNEQAWRNPETIEEELWNIWLVMRNSVYRGCHTAGLLPGGLNVKRRAAEINKKLLGDESYENADEWLEILRSRHFDFSQVVKWIGCFALAVNEENANFGRIVTAPTNGASGVIPAVLFYYICFSGRYVNRKNIINFLLIAGEIGSIFKKGATISAAMGGCQAEIGVSSAMAAAALTECLGGNVEQALMAAEIAMEHHLGLTCDPINGLVQVPCIERNSMGAVKAITACNIALESDPKSAKVSLDDVIKTMWETAKDMSSKYKETSQGGLAVNISIRVPECWYGFNLWNQQVNNSGVSLG